jgi:type I restriction enzyme S subunit
MDSDLWLKDGDILIQRGNSLEYVGIAAVYHGDSNEFIYPDLMMKVRVPNTVSVIYVHRFLNCRPTRNYFQDNASGTSSSMPKINQLTVRSLPFALPPLAEQHRIVARVDELMALCDELQDRLQSVEDISRILSAAMVHHLDVETPMSETRTPQVELSA